MRDNAEQPLTTPTRLGGASCMADPHSTRPKRRSPMPKGSDPVEYWLLRRAEDPVTGCWTVGTYKNSDGYPLTSINGKNAILSRLVLAKKLGRPLTASALHTCDNSACINPDHLYEGTQAQNIADRTARGRGCPLPGELNGRAKLTGEQVDYIRSVRGKVTARILAEEFGVTESNIENIWKGKIWKRRLAEQTRKAA